MTSAPRLTALKDVLARVEAATGPDREIDCLIEDEIGESSDMPGTHLLGAFNRGRFSYLSAVSPKFTASLDACLSLADRVLPSGTDWKLMHAPMSGEPPYEAAVYLGGFWGAGDEDANRAAAETPALAFLAAVLKALIAVEKKAGGKPTNKNV